VAGDVALVAGNVISAEAVVATVARAAEGDAGVAAGVAGAAATSKATDGLRFSSAPSPTALPSFYTTSPTPSRSRLAWRAPRRATQPWVTSHRLWGRRSRRALYFPAR